MAALIHSCEEATSTATSAHHRYHGGASAFMAPRWIPKRGQVLKKVLKTVFSCLCFDHHQLKHTSSSNPTKY
ncbi:unnamed protein product [Prunus armeniaca]|uniref:Uncharacterized protein n=1 Tax=Prunus armeniaca TaxID=36596 RepID=A0A6J5WC55_PRUAR|nr:unnamed protein product [Prunus armeniaca]CAB4295898.1 unnamed protein product [Prunus armeniaca]